MKSFEKVNNLSFNNSIRISKVLATSIHYVRINFILKLKIKTKVEKTVFIFN